MSRAASSRSKLIARGLGRSYGDAAQSAGGMVLDATGMDRILESDLRAGTVRVGAGLSLDALMRWLVPKGWWVPVSPGTRYVTVGGAIAADIHGKNHHSDGSFSAHVASLRLATPGGAKEVSKEIEPDVFWATTGGMGLTGVVLDATIRLLPIRSAYMLVDTEKAKNLDDCLSLMEHSDHLYRYSVAWIDCLAGGRRLGRSVLTRANHAVEGDVPAGRQPLAFEAGAPVEMPFDAPSGLLNPFTVAAFNEAWYRKAPGRRVHHPEAITSYFHPLDGVGSWNRLYGRRGLVQYQFVVPFGREEELRRVLEKLSDERAASFLAVLKRFGDAGGGHLSFPAPGWTLALDLPARTAGLSSLLDALDEIVITAGGRVYLAKDSRLSQRAFRSMYPRVDEWLSVRERLDPDGVLSSDLAIRLGICASGNSVGRLAGVSS